MNSLLIRYRRHLILMLAVLAVLVVGWATVALVPRRAPSLVVEEWVSASPQTADKLVMLEFWATWCGPCVAAIPDTNQLQQRFRDDLVVIAISNEPADVVRSHVQPAITYASAVDTQARMSRTLGVREIPASLIIDPDGIIRWRGDPFLHNNLQRNRGMWDELLDDLIARYGRKEPS
jgi:thiol-disulfide isomerase/thioredoxin